MGRKGCVADVEKEKFERFLEKRGCWEEKKGFFFINPRGDSVEKKMQHAEGVWRSLRI